jgi:hypothetical protein
MTADNHQSITLITVGWIMASPVAILMLLAMDLVFIFNTAFLQIALNVISLSSFGILDATFISETIDDSYE